MKHSIFHFLLSLILVSSLFLSPFYSVFAEEFILDLPDILPDEGGESDFIEPSIMVPDKISGTVDCFDYYTFGSIDVSLSSSIDSTVSGSPLYFDGKVHNNNPYPVVDVSVYAKVFGTDMQEEKSTIGPDVFGIILIEDGINLPADGAHPLSFSWDVPSNLPTGDYQLATFVTSGGAFNMAGLLFREDIVANSVPFSIQGEYSAIPIFIKNQTMLNGEQYRFVSADPILRRNEEATIVHSVKNPTNEKQQVSVNWTLYSWDSLQDGMISAVIHEQGDSAILEPGETTSFSYATIHSDYPVYYLVAELSYRDVTSIVSVRFIREGIQSPRLNFVGMDRFPLNQGEEATLFACAHGMGTADVLEDNTISLIITDWRGRELHSYTYEGDITGLVMGFADTFSPPYTVDRFTIKAELTHEGKAVDRKELTYDCRNIDPSTCIPSSFMFDRTIDPIVAAGLIIFVFLGAILLIVLIQYKRRTNL